MKFEKIKVPSQRELFIRRMQEMILSGELAVEEKIPPERELAESMGISRTIVNTGMAVLETQGFLEVVPRQGIFVADYKRNASIETLNAIMRLKGDIISDKDIRSILEIRWALEKLTIKNAMEKLGEDSAAELHTLVEKIHLAASPQEAAETAMEFQRRLAEIGENQMLMLIIVNFKAPCVAMWVRFCRLYGIDTLYQHTLRSLELLEAGDYQKALDWIEQFTKDAIEGQYTLYEKDLR